MVAFDFAGAFDCANWQIILDKLAESAVDPYLINMVCSYLNNRGVGFRDGDTWVRFSIDRGCPQGSCLGPLFWNLIANDILKAFDDDDCDLFAYADDFSMIISGNSRLDLEVKSNKLIAKFASISDQLSLEISVSKTQVISLGADLSRSLSAVTALGNIYPKSPIILDILKRCKTLGFSRFIRLNWIKAHAGFLGNELADFLAGSSVGLVPVCTRIMPLMALYSSFWCLALRGLLSPLVSLVSSVGVASLGGGWVFPRPLGCGWYLCRLRRP
ncbi:hypothetical protein JTE90_012408 [Oedothorax gibbosus]|uniref:Reverse transcriptase domain-containing protein n=1 Tax=Oedothorax gibbosus TaxID=931172 RepID=A0AAV6TW22_9ARAC|nr:hypothetical protein JTE90_012408 [Oedothorax gibbosus]